VGTAQSNLISTSTSNPTTSPASSTIYWQNSNAPLSISILSQTPLQTRGQTPETAHKATRTALSTSGGTSDWSARQEKVAQKESKFFTVVFYGLGNFGCKTAQFCVTQRECRMAELPSVRDDVQRSENERKNSFLNYESPALTAELQARVAHTVKHSTSQMTNPESVRGCSNR
jgi:hypothetical protein